MPNFKKISIISILIILPFITSGCVKTKNTKDLSKINGGVFKSVDRGTVWKQKVLMPSLSGRPGNFAGANAASMFMDPQDRNAIYFGSVGSGLFYTYDGGNSWQKSKGLGNVTIRAIAVAPDSKCTLYAAVGNKVFKSIDCSRSWSQVYFDNNLTTTVDALAIDHFNPDKIYIGVSRGDIIRSSDKGESWQTIYRAESKINKIVIDPSDSRNIYALTEKKGVYYSLDGGGSWKDMNKVFKEFKFKLTVKDLSFAFDDGTKVMYLASGYGILFSKDNGETWEQIKLIPPEKNASINAMAVNPKNSREIYYATKTTFYRTQDGGENWTPSKLPTSRAAQILLIDPEDPKIIYLGVKGTK